MAGIASYSALFDGTAVIAHTALLILLSLARCLCVNAVLVCVRLWFVPNKIKRKNGKYYMRYERTANTVEMLILIVSATLAAD